jgi:hypothetical protein
LVGVALGVGVRVGVCVIVGVGVRVGVGVIVGVGVSVGVSVAVAELVAVGVGGLASTPETVSGVVLHGAELHCVDVAVPSWPEEFRAAHLTSPATVATHVWASPPVMSMNPVPRPKALTGVRKESVVPSPY